VILEGIGGSQERKFPIFAEGDPLNNSNNFDHKSLSKDSGRGSPLE